MSNDEKDITWVNQLRGLVRKELNQLIAMAEINDIAKEEFGIIVEVENNFSIFPILPITSITSPSVTTPINTPIDPPNGLPWQRPPVGAMTTPSTSHSPLSLRAV